MNLKESQIMVDTLMIFMYYQLHIISKSEEEEQQIPTGVRELPDGARQRKESIELASELLSEVMF